MRAEKREWSAADRVSTSTGLATNPGGHVFWRCFKRGPAVITTSGQRLWVGRAPSNVRNFHSKLLVPLLMLLTGDRGAIGPRRMARRNPKWLERRSLGSVNENRKHRAVSSPAWDLGRSDSRLRQAGSKWFNHPAAVVTSVSAASVISANPSTVQPWSGVKISARRLTSSPCCWQWRVCLN